MALKPGLWCDEIFSLAIATGHSLEHPAATAEPGLGDFVEPRGAEPAGWYRRYVEHDDPPAGFARVLRAVLLSDTSPPLYYLALDLWQRVAGGSDAALRLFSTACALLSLGLLWSLAYRLAGRRAAFLAALIFSVAPPAVYYAAEGRMYALTWLFGLALVRTTLAMAHDGRGVGPVVAWILISAGGLLTHYFFAFVCIAAMVWLLLYGRGQRARAIAMAAVVGLLVLPWYVRVPASLRAWRVTAGWLDTPLDAAGLASGFVRLAASSLNSYGVWGGLLVTMRVQAVLIAVLALALVRRGLRPLLAPERLLPIFWLVASVLGPLVFDVLRGTATSHQDRYALPGLPAAILVFALAIDHVFRPAGVAVLLGTFLAWIPGLVDMAVGPSRWWQPFPIIAQRLEGWTAPDDLVIVSSIPSGVIAVARYVDPRTPVAAWVQALGNRKMPDDAEALTDGRCRVAFVAVHDLGVRAPVDSWLRARATTVATDVIVEEPAVHTEITYFTLPGRDGRCADRSPPSRTPASNGPGTARPPERRSGG